MEVGAAAAPLNREKDEDQVRSGSDSSATIILFRVHKRLRAGSVAGLTLVNCVQNC